MSDPTGKGTTPETPSFSSSPEGYASTTLTVQSLGGSPKPTPVQKSPYVVKGYAPGTFVPMDGKTGSKYPVQPKMSPSFPRVGSEIKNPETEELLRLGKLAKQEGFIFETDKDGNIESVEIPKAYAGEEDELRVELKQKEIEASVLKEMIPVSIEYTALQAGIPEFAAKLQNPATLALLETVSDELKKLIEEIQATPLAQKLEEAKDKLIELKKTTRRAKDEIAKLPVPPSVTPAPTPPPTAAPTPAPTAAPKPPEPLREYGGWPSGVYPRKQSKGVAGGWFSMKRNDLLPDQEAWQAENEAFKVIFKKYLDFIRGISSQERRLAKPLIDVKNQLVEAVKDEDVTRVEVFREEFEKAIEIWKNRFSYYYAAQFRENLLKNNIKEADKLPTQFQSQLLNKKQACETAIAEAKRDAFIKDPTDDVIREGLDKIDAALRAYEDTIKKYQSLTKQQKATQEAVHGAWSHHPLTKERKLVGVLRPVPTTLDDKNKHQKIRIVGRKDPITLEEYNKEREAKENLLNTKTITDDDLDEWPELAKAGYKAQQTVEKKWFDQFQVRTGYERAFARNENSFISLYATPSLDEATNGVRYTENERLKTHPNRELILEMLHSHGIEIIGQTREERRAGDATKAEEERLKKNANTITYHPNQVKKVSLFGKNDGLVKGYHSTSQMAKQNPETLPGAENRFFALKNKRERYLGNPTDSAFEDKEQGLLEKLRRATNNRGTDKEKESFISLQKALNAYEQELRPLIEKQKEEAKLPTDSVEKERRVESLKKIDAILGNKLDTFKKKVPKGKLWVIFAAAVVSGSMLADSTMKDAAPSAPPAQSQEKKDAWRDATYEFRHQDRFAAFSKEFVDDIMKLNNEELMKKHAPRYFNNPNANNQNSAEGALKYEGNELFGDDPRKLFSHLSLEQRGELSGIWKHLKGTSLAATGKPLTASTFGEALEEMRKAIIQKEK